ncbi:unnamed protein product [Durusdinium trenchii]|uniref:Uncharacterized protein n=1 Tax=Durusdinium trenchii TaxID=1381693 RepID=A0ABP0H6R8_9DINO
MRHLDIIFVVLLEATATAQNLTSTPFASLDCASTTKGDANWLWEASSGTWHSCNLPVRGDIGSMCIGSSGKPDYTSLFVDLASAPIKDGCFAWLASACSMDFRRVKRIEFDFDMKSCGSVWAAPLWMSPSPWDSPGRTSGEVDLVEACPVGSLYTNFATGGHEMVIGNPDNLGGPKHLIMTLDRSASLESGGTLRTEICDLGPTNCHPSAYYDNFLGSVSPSKGRGQSFPYNFISDIWNGFSGDAGWVGCKAFNNPHTQCQYVVHNIKVYTVNGSPMFSGKCGAMNGDAQVEVQFV